MRWIVAALLWAFAIVVALVVLRRMRRGKPVVLAGRWSPRVIRMVAVVLVVLGSNEETTAQELTAKPIPPTTDAPADPLPKNLSVHVTRSWLYMHTPGSVEHAAKTALAKVLANPSPTAEEIAAVQTHFKLWNDVIKQLVEADLKALKEGKPFPVATAAQLSQAIKVLQAHGYYDHWWNAYLWRKATNVDVAHETEWTHVFAQLRTNARVTDVLIRAQAQVKPVMVSRFAWGSKAGPGPAERQAMVVEANAINDMLKIAGEVYPTTDEGTWKRDSIVLLKADKDVPAPILLRGGLKKDFSGEFNTRLGRLDLLKTGDKPCVLVHDGLGKIELPANTLVPVAQLGQYVTGNAKRKLDELVQEALTKNSEEAADRLETMLPLAHDAIRTGLKEHPKAKGSPRLRLILSLHDDIVMPLLKVAETAEFSRPGSRLPGGPGGGPGGGGPGGGGPGRP